MQVFKINVVLQEQAFNLWKTYSHRKDMEIRKVLFILTFLTLLFTGCEQNINEDEESGASGNTEEFSSDYSLTVDEAMSENKSYHGNSGDYTWSSTGAGSIILNGSSISASGSGISVDGTNATITAGGTYIISGTLDNGRIIVDSDDSLTVKLVLDNANITSSENSPVTINNADKTVIILADNSGNTITDPSQYIYDSSGETEPDAAIFSRDDLSISGSGTLTVNANYKDGIASKDGLVINSGTINITAADDGIRGKDYLVIRNGTISVDAGGDGMKSTEDSTESKGYILVEDGNIEISCGSDGLDAATDVLISGGNINLTTGGGSGVSSGDNSEKGIKGNTLVVIDNCTLYVNSSDDAIHSNGRITVNDGDIELLTNDDGIHGESSVVINGGTVYIKKSYEGIESSLIAVTGGSVNVVSTDDSFNSTAGKGTESNDGSCTYIYGGYIVLNAGTGDGLDSNGSIVMTGGTVIIHGPSKSPEVMIDYNGSFKISGGFLAASGSSSNMTQAPSTGSAQNSIRMMFNSSNSVSTLFHIEDSDGNNIVTFQPLHKYQSVVFSSSELVTGKTYSVYTGGTSTGEITDGIYIGGTYTAGTKKTTFTVNNSVTSLN